MSTITGLISAGGGAGGGGATNIVTNPTHLWKVIARQTGFDLRYNTSLYDPGLSTFYSSLDVLDFAYWAECTTANTYVTVADISSASNGGYLYCAIGVGTLGGESTTFKFTVDGVVTEITYSNPTSQTTHYCPAMGGFYPNPQTSADQSPFNTADLRIETTSGIEADGFYRGGLANALAYPFMSHNMDMSRLRFESSLKLEVKKSVIGATVEDNRASAFITLS